MCPEDEGFSSFDGDYLNPKFCVAIYLAKSQGEIKCNLALISAGKKTLK